MKRLLLAAVFATVLAACAAAPTTTVPTFNQLALIAGSANDAIVLLDTSLVKAGTITSAQAEKVATVTDAVNAMLTAANAANVAGNITLATSNLANANAALATAQSCLTAPTVGTTLDSCLGPVVNPKAVAAHKAKVKTS